MDITRARAVIAAAALIAPATFGGSLHAETGKCQRTIVRSASNFARHKSNVLAKCELKRIKGTHPDPCPDAADAQKIAEAAASLAEGIADSCGGRDRVCGGNLTKEDSPASIGFPATCPNFENGACTQAIGDCGDIVSCLECIDESAVDQAIALYFGSLVASDPKAERELNKCQQEIGKRPQKFLAKKIGTLKKCWQSRIDGKHSDVCPDANGGHFAQNAAENIAAAEGGLIRQVCKACGGADKLCDQSVTGVNPLTPAFPGSGNADDLTPAAIGFPATCPDVTVPGGPSCSGAVTTLADLVECLACVTEFKVDCLTRAQIPQFGPLPAECNP